MAVFQESLLNPSTNINAIRIHTFISYIEHMDPFEFYHEKMCGSQRWPLCIGLGTGLDMQITPPSWLRILDVFVTNIKSCRTIEEVGWAYGWIFYYKENGRYCIR